MPWLSPGMDSAGWMGVALIVGWFGLLALTGMIARAVSERKKRDK